MILVKHNNHTYELSWSSGKWKDKAGHIWWLDQVTGLISCPNHGQSSTWNITSKFNFQRYGKVAHEKFENL